MSSGTKRKAPDESGEIAPPPAAGTQPRSGVLSADLLRGLQDPDLCDITLVGSDGGKVPAARLILAMRSAVFESMLLGKFKEGGSDEISLDYPSAVLEYVVEYCCSDEISRFKQLVENGITSPMESCDFAVARSLVETIAAAHFLELSGLESWLKILLDTLMKGVHVYACAVWDQALKCASLGDVQSSALSIIHAHPEACLLEPDECKFAGVESLCSESLDLLLQDEKFTHGEPLTLFQAIQNWLEATKKEVGEGSEKEKLLETAKAMASKLDLRFIPAYNILGIVRDSGLFDSDTIVEVLAKQRTPAVFLCGAGLPCINGLYEASGTCVGSSRVYTKVGELNGTNVTCKIAPIPGSRSRCWGIWAGDGRFYSSKFSCDVYLKTSGNGWKTELDDGGTSPSVFAAPNIS